jgi:hypothetical protein
MVKLRKQNKTKRQRKQTKHNKHNSQSGGFYPSVYGGITSATILLPMLVRQLIHMYTNPTNTRKTKKVKENKRKK